MKQSENEGEELYYSLKDSCLHEIITEQHMLFGTKGGIT